MMRSIMIAVVTASMLTQAAVAAPATDEDKQFMRFRFLVAADAALNGANQKNAPGTGLFKMAREQCDAAKVRLAGFDPDHYWAARVEDCFGMIAGREGNRRLVRTLFKRASELLNKAESSGGNAAEIGRTRSSIGYQIKMYC
jgi:hypothetical protein